MLHGGPLLFVLDAISGPIFGVDLYPSLEEKVCKLAHTIAARHVFLNGNKKTAASVLELTFELNGHVLLATEDEMVDMMESIGRGEISYEALVDWVRARLT